MWGEGLWSQNTCTTTKQYLSNNPVTDKKNNLPNLDKDGRRAFHTIESYQELTEK